MLISSCLICGQDEVDKDKEHPYPSSSSLYNKLKMVLVFHKILHIPLSECVECLEEEGSLSSFSCSSFCQECCSLINKSIELSSQITGLEKEMNEIKGKLMGQLLFGENELSQPGSLFLSRIKGNIKQSHQNNKTVVAVAANKNKYIPIIELSVQEEDGFLNEDNDGEENDGIGIITQTMSMAQDQENDALSIKIEPEQEEQYYQEHDVDVEEASSCFYYENQGETDFFIQNHGEIDYNYSYSSNSTQPGSSRSFLKKRKRANSSHDDIDDSFGSNSSTTKQFKRLRRPAPRSFTCLLCDLNVDNALQLGAHYTGFHGNPTYWSCNAEGCSVTGFDKKEKLYNHRKNIHQNLPINLVPNSCQNVQQRRPGPGRPRKSIKVKDHVEEQGQGQTQGQRRPGRPRKVKVNNIVKVEDSEVKVKKEIEIEIDIDLTPPKRYFFTCLLCDEVHTNKITLGHHYDVDHGAPTSWKCKDCGLSFPRRSYLYVHRIKVHKNLPRNNRGQGEQSSNHGKPDDPAYTTDHNEVKVQPENFNNTFSCVLCLDDVIFSNPIALELHYSGFHSSPMEWSCPECPFTGGSSKERLIFHRKTHKKDEDLPPILTANLPLPPIPQLDFDDDNEGQGQHDLVELDLEVDPPIIVSKEEKVKLKLVKKSSKSKHVHKNRVNKIIKRRNYFCLLCHKLFTNSVILGAHYSSVHKSAQDENNWPCNFPSCSAILSSRLSLYKHRQILHKNLPINLKPPIWGLKKKSSSLSGQKSQKKKNRLKPKHPQRNYTCILCDHVVADPVTLGSHYSQQHGNVTEWRCNIEGCGLLLKTRDTLYYHKKYTHKNKTDQEITHKGQTIEKETNQEQRIKNKIKPKLSATLQPPPLSVISIKKKPISYTKGNPSKAKIQQKSKISLFVKKKKRKTKIYYKKAPTLSSRSYSCILCPASFSELKSNLLHYTTQHGNNTNWDCNICGKHFDKKTSLYHHKRDVHDEGRRNYKRNLKKNSITNLFYKKPPNLNVSLENNEEKSPKICITKKFSCLLCFANFPDLKSNRLHYTTAHPDTTEWKCNLCDMSYGRRISLYNHKREIHQNVRNRGEKKPTILNLKKKIGPKSKMAQISDQKPETTIVTKKSRNFSCVLCSQDCQSAVGVVVHYSREHPTLSKNLKCSKCPRLTFSNYNALFSHQKYNHGIKHDAQNEVVQRTEKEEEKSVENDKTMQDNCSEPDLEPEKEIAT